MRAGGFGRGRGMGRWAGARAHAAERLASPAVCCGHCCLGCTQPDPLPTLLSPQPWRPGRFSPLLLPLLTLPWHWSHRDVTRTLPCTPRPAGEEYLRNTRALLVRASLMQHDLIQVPPCGTRARAAVPLDVCACRTRPTGHGRPALRRPAGASWRGRVAAAPRAGPRAGAPLRRWPCAAAALAGRRKPAAGRGL